KDRILNHTSVPWRARLPPSREAPWLGGSLALPSGWQWSAGWNERSGAAAGMAGRTVSPGLDDNVMPSTRRGLDDPAVALWRVRCRRNPEHSSVRSSPDSWAGRRSECRTGRKWIGTALRLGDD